MYRKPQQEKDSIWEQRKLEKNTFNLRQTNPFLVWCEGGRHEIAGVFGDISQLQVDENQWDVMFKIFAHRIFHEGHFSDEEIEVFREAFEKPDAEVEYEPLEVFGDAY